MYNAGRGEISADETRSGLYIGMLAAIIKEKILWFQVGVCNSRNKQANILLQPSYAEGD